MASVHEPRGFSLPGYDVEELVGFGATGEVWRARERSSGQLVALKRLRVDGPPQVRDRLRREAATLAGVASPHLVRMRTVVTSPDGLVLVLDLAGGGSLASVLATRRRLSPGEVVTVAVALARALADVHAAGLVHGDLSPANVLFATDGRPLLADLGVSRLVSRVHDEVAVTLDYADPAVLAGAPITPPCDVYALGAVCFHALTGAPPYAQGTAGDELPGGDGLPDGVALPDGVVLGARRALAELAPDVPAALVDVIEQAVALDPRLRPDAATLAAQLFAAVPPQPVRLTGATVPSAPPPTYQVRGAVENGAAQNGAGEPPSPAAGSRPWLDRVLPWRHGWSPGRVTVVLAAVAAPCALVAAVLAGVGWAHAGNNRAVSVDPLDVPTASTPAGPTAAGSTPVVQPRPTTPSPPPAPGPGGTTAHATSGTASTAPATAMAATPARVTTDPAAWRAVLDRLDGLRSRAFEAGRPELLAQVYAPGSAPLVEDSARLRQLVTQGAHAERLRLSVRDVAVMAVTSGEARLRVVDALAAYRIVDGTGHVISSSTGRGAVAWEIQLVSAGGGAGWRIAGEARA